MPAVSLFLQRARRRGWANPNYFCLGARLPYLDISSRNGRPQARDKSPWCMHPEKICQPGWRGRPRHPVVLPKAIFEQLKDSREETLKQFLQNNASAVALREMDDPGLDFDMDTPADYEKALQLSMNRVGRDSVEP